MLYFAQQECEEVKLRFGSLRELDVPDEDEEEDDIENALQREEAAEDVSVSFGKDCEIIHETDEQLLFQ